MEQRRTLSGGLKQWIYSVQIIYQAWRWCNPKRTATNYSLLDCGLQSMFQNVYVALRLFLTLPVSNCEGERSFSLLLSRIKNELRTKMSQKRLKALSLMAIESDLTNALDFDDIVWRISHGTEPGKNAFHRWNALLSINVRNCSYWVALSRFYLWLKAVHSKFVKIAKKLHQLYKCIILFWLNKDAFICNNYCEVAFPVLQILLSCRYRPMTYYRQ